MSMKDFKEGFNKLDKQGKKDSIARIKAGIEFTQDKLDLYLMEEKLTLENPKPSKYQVQYEFQLDDRYVQLLLKARLKTLTENIKVEETEMEILQKQLTFAERRVKE